MEAIAVNVRDPNEIERLVASRQGLLYSRGSLPGLWLAET